MIKLVSETERIFGEVKDYPIHQINLMKAISKELESGDIKEIRIIKSDCKRVLPETLEFELSSIDTLIKNVNELVENEKHSTEEDTFLRNVLHNCLIRLEQLKAIKAE